MRDQINFLVLVDDSSEMELALKFASMRAKSVNGQVTLLHVLDDAKYGLNWMGTGDVAKRETEEDAKNLLEKLSKRVEKWTGFKPVSYVRHGEKTKQLIELIDCTDVDMIILAASSDSKSPGPVIDFVIKHSSIISVPVVIVPTNLKDKSIQEMV